MAKTVGLKIEIEGLSSVTKEIIELEEEIKGLNEELKTADGEEQVLLRNRLALAKEEIKAARKEQREFAKELTDSNFAEGSYQQLNEQLRTLRKEFKSLSEEERDSDIGQNLKENIRELDTELKGIDASIGQFQRNVGNYPKLQGNIQEFFKNTIPGYRRFSRVITDANGNLNAFGASLAAGFIAFQGAKIINRSIKQLDQFIEKINETKDTVASFTGATGEELNQLTTDVSALSSAFGTDAEQISKSAEALANNLGISFGEALGLIEDKLVEGVASNEDYLTTIEEFPEKFESASGAVTELSERNRTLVEQNKALAESQIEVAERLEPTLNSLKLLGNTITTVILVAFANLIDLFTPVVKAFRNAGEAVGELIKDLFGAKSASDAFAGAGKFVQAVFQGVADAFTFVATTIRVVANGLRALNGLLQGDIVTAWKLYTEAGQQAVRVNKLTESSVEDINKAFIAQTKGLRSLFAQIKQTNQGSSERAELLDKLNEQYGEYLPNLNLETASQEELKAAYDAATEAIARQVIQKTIASKQEEAAVRFVEAQIEVRRLEKQAIEQTVEANKELSSSSGAIIESTKVAAEALTAGATGLLGFGSSTKEAVDAQKEFNAAQKQAKQDLEDSKIALQSLKDDTDNLAKSLSSLFAFDDIKAGAETTKKTASEVAKEAAKRQKAAAAAFAKLQAARAKFNESELKEERNRAALLLNIQSKLADEQIKLIEDEQARRIAEINRATDLEIEQIDSNTQKLLAAQEEREQKIVEQFGEGSRELLNSRAAFNEFLLELEVSNTERQVQLETNRQIELSAVRDEFNAKEVAEAKQLASELMQIRDENLNSELAFLDRQSNLRQLKSEEDLQRALQIAENAAEKIEIIRLAKEEETIRKIAGIRNKLQALDDQETELLRQQSEEQVAIKQEEYDRIEDLRQQLNTQLATLETQQTEEVARQSKARLDNLQTLVNSVASRTQQLGQLVSDFFSSQDSKREEEFNKSLEASKARQDQLNEELQNATGLRRKFLEQQLAAEQENAAKTEAAQEAAAKRAAKRQKAIAVTQSIIDTATAVLRAYLSQLSIPTPDAPIRAAAAAAATGVFGGAQTALIASQEFADGGLVLPFFSGGKITGGSNIKPTSKGDNVLATVKTGEVVLNKRQQTALGGASTFSKIGVPGFAAGGLIGGVATAPNLTGIAEASTRTLDAFNRRTEAIVQMVIKQQVVLSTDDLDEDNTNKIRIESNSTL